MFDAFLAEWQDKPAIWGVSDCCAWPAKWVKMATGLTVPLPAYSTQGEAARLIAKAGSLAALWRPRMAEIRLSRIHPEDARLGDVGIVDHEEGHKGFIFSASPLLGYIKAEVGIAAYPPSTAIAAWRV